MPHTRKGKIINASDLDIDHIKIVKNIADAITYY